MITLRPLKISDLDMMKEWMTDEDVTSFFRFNQYDEKKVMNFIEHSLVDEHNKHFAITDEGDEYIGTISLKNIDTVNFHAEYAIVIRKRYWGKSIGESASLLLFEYAQKIGLHKIYLNVLFSNNSAIRLYEKLGFEKSGVYKDHLLRNGHYLDLFYFEKILGGTHAL